VILHDFEYGRPATLQDAVTLLRENGEAAQLLAGGTDLLPNMRIEIQTPTMLISLADIEPAPPARLGDGSIRIDALSRLADLERDEVLGRALPMVGESIRAVGSNQVREMGTLGGNLCQETRCLQLNQMHDFQFVAPCYKRGGDCCYPFPNNAADVCWAVHMSDVAPALIALNAELEILGEAGSRRMPVARLFTNDGLRPLTLGHAEIISAVIVPPLPPRSGWGYHKSTVRGGLEFAMAVMAVLVRLDESADTCAEARIVLGAVRQGPFRPAETEAALQGQRLDADSLAKAARDASREVRPLPHSGYTVTAMNENIRVYLGRILADAAERARHGHEGVGEE
jgi:4-hydroxybenzoyl-CoA reductase beta subunit